MRLARFRAPVWLAVPIIAALSLIAPVLARPNADACSAAVHDAYTTPGPDGQSYPTWHPPIDPASGCSFGHEHGADPRTSTANNTLPPFGYVASLDGMSEPHQGFKVFVVHLGEPVDIAGAMTPSPVEGRLVFHMGTAAVGRYTNQFHSMLFDEVHPDGRAMHLQGMADTGSGIGSTCDIPRKGGRDFSTVGCNDAYEIWSFKFKVIHPDDPYTAVDQVRATGMGAVAAFDPITTRDPSDNSRLLYTEVYRSGPQAADPLSPLARYRGCNRESYLQSYWWNSSSRPGSSATYWTDVHGHVNKAGQAPGLLRQDVTQSARSSLPQLKQRVNSCDPTTHSPN